MSKFYPIKRFRYFLKSKQKLFKIKLEHHINLSIIGYFIIQKQILVILVEIKLNRDKKIIKVTKGRLRHS